MIRLRGFLILSLLISLHANAGDRAIVNGLGELTDGTCEDFGVGDGSTVEIIDPKIKKITKLEEVYGFVSNGKPKAPEEYTDDYVKVKILKNGMTGSVPGPGCEGYIQKWKLEVSGTELQKEVKSGAPIVAPPPPAKKY